MAAPTAETLAEALAPLTEAPERAAVLCDIDGTLAPIVERAEDAHVPGKASRLLGALARRYALVGCVSGRSAAEARRLVGVGGIAYAGAHGAELIKPGASSPEVAPAFASWRGRVRIEDKGPIAAFHWRGAPDEDAARTRIEGIAQEAEAAGFATHWGRKVLEVRPPVPFDKGLAIRHLLGRAGVRAAMYGGDDATDLDGFAALDDLVAGGELEAALRVGVRSDEGPEAIVERADLVVDGVEGFVQVLAVLAEA